jgi:hypothetical protein
MLNVSGNSRSIWSRKSKSARITKCASSSCRATSLPWYRHSSRPSGPERRTPAKAPATRAASPRTGNAAESSRAQRGRRFRGAAAGSVWQGAGVVTALLLGCRLWSADDIASGTGERSPDRSSPTARSTAPSECARTLPAGRFNRGASAPIRHYTHRMRRELRRRFVSARLSAVGRGWADRAVEHPPEAREAATSGSSAGSNDYNSGTTTVSVQVIAATTCGRGVTRRPRTSSGARRRSRS